MTRRRFIVRSRPKTPTAQILFSLIEVLKPLFVVLGFVIKTVYRVFFGWWLNPVLQRAAQKSLADDIKRGAPFLFGQYQGKIVPCLRPEGHDRQLSYVCIATMNLLFEFSRWRSDIQTIRVSPLFSPNDSFDLLQAFLAVDPSARLVLPNEIVSWHQFGRLLEPRIDLLEAAFNRENFNVTKNRLEHF